ncbi:hypothetical protein ACQKQD_32085 [Methylobacterium sp. NPDC080182]|uniref:hypothetical protein n=1 Tax=Methylobacterium sp. NPDC080182 TaxID=3390590 RepID=UPI003CFC9D14
MGGFDPFAMFKKALSELEGLPDGLTVQEVQSSLENQYKSIFDAFKEYERLGRYRAASFSVTVAHTQTDRADYRSTYSVNVRAPNSFSNWHFDLTRTEIRPTIEYLIEHAPEKRGYWKAEETDEFIEFLGHYLLSLFKPRSAQDRVGQSGP